MDGRDYVALERVCDHDGMRVLEVVVISHCLERERESKDKLISRVDEDGTLI